MFLRPDVDLTNYQVVVVLIVVADMLASFGRTVATGLRPKEATFHGIADPS